MALVATKEMCLYCFQVVDATLRRQPLPVAGPDVVPAGVEAPAFVCFKFSRTGDLRGCIGTFEPQPLGTVLQRYATASAFEDRRFNPVSPSEFPKLTCTVSLLHSFEPASNCYDWTVGTHGITINFKHGGRRMHATFLPRVAAEQGWDKAETLQHLVKKAGYNGPMDEVFLATVATERYQDSECSATYDEYVAATQRR